VLTKLFLPRSKKTPFSFRPRHMHFGHALDSTGETLDEVLAVFMPGPHSATGEDVGEIHSHGGPGVAAALLESVIAAGARPAEAGEFTRRAFFHGRMDLTQAEAVAELINAPTREGIRLAAAKLEGALGREVRSLRAALESLRTQLALTVDFPDEDAGPLPRNEFADTVRQGKAAIGRLLAGFERARLWREGAKAVLTGRVNAGKSSLFNALLGRERAIVSGAPGTTRDYIEESVSVAGIPLRLIDTAGLRLGGDIVEEEGIRRARDLADEAELVLFVADVREDIRPEERDFLRRHWPLLEQGRLLMVMNKIDALSSANEEEALTEGAAAGRRFLEAAASGMEARAPAASPCYGVSARGGGGMQALMEGVRVALGALGGACCAGGDIAPNLRQSLLLRQTLDELLSFETALAAGYPPDILGVHLEAAAAVLSSVTGASSSEELLNSVFSSFCIGK
jgi:tRNA modification GTPase